ncbi:amino acid racemase, partial [Candidatus Woesearchaeota archaeon]|nr:amino acid racemase [Candidatus Woesearchaeota archaeon]
YDSDFPEMVIVNVPLPDVVEKAGGDKEKVEMLVSASKKLENSGADFIAIPCNTVTKYVPEMEKAVSIPIINIIRETANAVLKLGLKKVALIGTEATIKSCIYSRLLKGTQVLALNKTEQKETTEIILNILAGKQLEEDKGRLTTFIKKLKLLGAEKVILGCTDLPLLTDDKSDTVSSLDVLAEVSVEMATGKNYLSQPIE